MIFLWTADLRINTVHATDVARAAWHVADWYVKSGKSGHGATLDELVFNLADLGDTSKYYFLWNYLFVEGKRRTARMMSVTQVPWNR